MPNVATSEARIKVEAVGNVFFDVSDADLAIQGAPVVTTDDQTVQYSDAVGRGRRRRGARRRLARLGAHGHGHRAAGRPVAGGRLDLGRRRPARDPDVDARRHRHGGARHIRRRGHRDGRRRRGITPPLTVTVTPEDAEVAYAGDTLASGQVLLRATVKDSDDGAPGDIRTPP